MLLAASVRGGIRVPHEKGQGAAFSFDNLNRSWLGALLVLAGYYAGSIVGI